jgi:hypothetical protein
MSMLLAPGKEAVKAEPAEGGADAKEPEGDTPGDDAAAA